MKITILAAVSALALLTALPATAADLLATPAPVVAEPAADWSGVYIGAHAGYGFAGLNEVGDEEYGYDISGLLAGAQIGARQQFDNFVLGVQGDISWSGQKGAYRHPDGSTNGDDTYAINWQGSLSGRAGVALDNALLYGLAGLTVAGATADWGAPHHATLVGGTVGVGAELKLSDGWSAFGEYSFTRFGNAKLSDTSYSYGGDAHAVKVGLNYSF